MWNTWSLLADLTELGWTSLVVILQWCIPRVCELLLRCACVQFTLQLVSLCFHPLTLPQQVAAAGTSLGCVVLRRVSLAHFCYHGGSEEKLVCVSARFNWKNKDISRFGCTTLHWGNVQCYSRVSSGKQTLVKVKQKHGRTYRQDEGRRWEQPVWHTAPLKL